MHRQFLLGDESEYAPYINYLKNQPRGRIPSEWTDAGKHLLRAILDHEDLFDDESGLPTSAVDDFRDIWIEECRGEDTPLARTAFYQFTSRDEDTLSEFSPPRTFFRASHPAHRADLSRCAQYRQWYPFAICTTTATIPRKFSRY